MSVRYSFMDNASYGAEDINYALSRLTTQGVSLFQYSDGDNPLIALNDAVAAMASPGVEYYNTDACLLTYDSANSLFKILPGTAFMADGSFITIEDDAYNITDAVTNLRKTEDGKLYVYFYRNVPMNCIEIRVEATEIPTDENALPIGEILPNNKVFDLRKIARAKIAPAGGNIVTKFTYPSYEVRYTDTGSYRLRAEQANIFEGASYCYYANQVFKLQRVSTTDGTGLEFNQAEYAASNDPRVYVAFNLVNGKLQLWAYTTHTYIPVNPSTVYVF